MKVRTLLALLFPFTLFAQSPYVQGGSVNASPDTIYSVTGSWAEGGPIYTYTFAQPLVSPCTLLVSVRQPGQVVSDTQGNSFIQLSTGYTQLWYSKTCSSGPDTIKVTCPSLCWSQFTASEYAGSWVLDQQSPEVYGVNSATGWTASIMPTQSGELIIGIGSNSTTNTPQITAGTGWTLRANADEFIEDMVQATAAPVASAVTYSVPSFWSQITYSFMPTGMQTSGQTSGHSAILTWEASSALGAMYNVYRGTAPNCSYVLLAGGVVPLTYTDSTIIPGNSYCYKVTAVLNGWESDSSILCVALIVQ